MKAAWDAASVGSDEENERRWSRWDGLTTMLGSGAKAAAAAAISATTATGYNQRQITVSVGILGRINAAVADLERDGATFAVALPDAGCVRAARTSVARAIGRGEALRRRMFLSRLVDTFGGISAAAHRIGIAESTVSRYRSGCNAIGDKPWQRIEAAAAGEELAPVRRVAALRGSVVGHNETDDDLDVDGRAEFLGEIRRALARAANAITAKGAARSWRTVAMLASQRMIPSEFAARLGVTRDEWVSWRRSRRRVGIPERYHEEIRAIAGEVIADLGKAHLECHAAAWVQANPDAAASIGT